MGRHREPLRDLAADLHRVDEIVACDPMQFGTNLEVAGVKDDTANLLLVGQAMDTMELPEIIADEAAQMGTDAPTSLMEIESDAFLERVREQERFKWLEEKMERWIGQYSVPELIDILGTAPKVRGQHEKALVALALSDGTNALSALEDLPMDDRPDSFKRLHSVCMEQARRRRNLGSRH